MDGGGPAPEHTASLEAVERAAWDLMVQGALSRRSPFHQAQVGTVGLDGGPTVRTVVLRGADRAARILRFHTDRRSRKVPELRRDPRCTVLFYDYGAKVQVRVIGRATLFAGEGPAAEIWAGMREGSRACYRQPLPPGAPLEEPGGAAADEPLSTDEGFANFVVVHVGVQEFEWLYLAAAGHRRARIGYTPAPSAVWLAP